METSSSESQYSANSAEVPPGLDMHQTLAQRFLHQTSVARVQCDAWAYLGVADGPGFIFPEPTGFFPVLFAPVSAKAAVGCAVCMLISFARGVSGDGGAATAWLPWSEGSAVGEGIGWAWMVSGPPHGDLSASDCSVGWTECCWCCRVGVYNIMAYLS